MRLTGLQPGATVEEVVQNTGFELVLAEEIAQLDAPTSEELAILRELDPSGAIPPLMPDDGRSLQSIA